MHDLVYDGTTLSWPARGKKWKATSGMPASSSSKKIDHRNEKYQHVKNLGPLPEGRYSLSLIDYGLASEKPGWCKLNPHGGIQHIPRLATGTTDTECEPTYANWGWSRVRLEPSGTNHKAKKFGRAGFYIHDSSKGYSHGCIETESGFFSELRAESRARKKAKRTLILRLNVIYKDGQTTYGGTKVYRSVARP